MREFDYGEFSVGSYDKKIVSELIEIMVIRNGFNVNPNVKPEVLNAMARIAKAHSTASSNRIEGIRTTDKRLREIMGSKTNLNSRDEEEIAGYRDALQIIHENYEYMDVTPNVILQLHQRMYRHTQSSLGGHFKVGDNEIRGVREDGSGYVRFVPVPAVATPDAMSNLCLALRHVLESDDCEAIKLVSALRFIFDFTCIHPFNDGNGRISRLLTLLLMYKLGFTVGKYISIEKKIEESKNAYYAALRLSSEGWQNGGNDASPFVLYMLQVIKDAYSDLSLRAETVASSKLSKAKRVEALLRNSSGKVTKAEIMEECPDIGKITVERALHDLLDAGSIKTVGGGRSTGYVWYEICDV